MLASFVVVVVVAVVAGTVEGSMEQTVQIKNPSSETEMFYNRWTLVLGSARVMKRVRVRRAGDPPWRKDHRRERK